MGDPSRVRVRGPLEPYAAGFGVELGRLGYTPLSAANQLWLMAHLSRWLAAQRLGAAELTPARVSGFLVARRAAGYTQWCSAQGLAPLLGYLREVGAAPRPVAPVAVTPAEELLERYRGYLLGERGLTAGTVRGYVDRVRPFVAAHVGSDGLGLGGLTAAQVSGYVLGAVRGRGPGSAKLLVTALRSLLMFLHVTGEIPTALAAAVPSVAGWRLAGLPRALEDGALRALLASCDRTTATGRRDFAILTLLARLGLRAGEVAALRLERHRLARRRDRGPRQGRPPGAAAAARRRRRGGGRPTCTTGRRVERCRAVFVAGAGAAPRLTAGGGDPARGAGPDTAPGCGQVGAAPAAPHRGHRDAARRRVAGRGRPGAAPPQPR